MDSRSLICTRPGPCRIHYRHGPGSWWWAWLARGYRVTGPAGSGVGCRLPRSLSLTCDRDVAGDGEIPNGRVVKSAFAFGACDDHCLLMGVETVRAAVEKRSGLPSDHDRDTFVHRVPAIFCIAPYSAAHRLFRILPVWRRRWC